MAVSLGSNISALAAKRRLDDVSQTRTRVFERLSSGLRINRASDDAAGLAVSSTLNASSRVFGQGIRNINDGLSTLAIADSTLSDLSGIVVRMRELSQQAANGTFSDKQRIELDKEAQLLSREYFRISRASNFNGLNLFDGTLREGLRIQAGFGVRGSVQSTFGGALGSGMFSASTTDYGVEVGGQTFGVALGDLNGDGVQDLISVGTDSSVGYAAVRLGQGNGTFGAEVSFATEGYSSQAVNLSDLNNDGVLDLITAGTDGLTGFATIRFGIGNGTFGVAVSYATEDGQSNALAVGDVNGDGRLDLVTAGTGAAGAATVRLGTGDGQFAATANTIITEDFGTNGVTLGDVNNDGKLDMVTTGAVGAGGRTNVRIGNGDGTFKAGVQYVAEAANSMAVALGDLNGDGILDLVSSGHTGAAGGFNVRLGNSNGTFGATTPYAGLSGSTLSAFSLADVNGDNILDIVANEGFGSIVRLGNGNGTFQAPLSTPNAQATATAIALGDVDGDGVLDLVTGGTGGARSVEVQTAAIRDGLNPLLPFSFKTRAGALQSMGYLDRKLASLSSQRGTIGAFQSRLATALSNLQSTKDNYTAAASRITDADVASESAELARTQILQQTASAVMSQANQTPALALLLLR